MKRIYLDNAVTSWPKPEVVYAAVDRYLRENGAPAGRSVYAQATDVEIAIASARAAVARIIGAADAKQIVFTTSGTTALNLAIHGLLRPGDHAICTDADHNSVLRPLRHLEEHSQVEVTRVPCNSMGMVDPDDIRRALKPNTRLVAMVHASNVTGIVEPAAEVGRIVREHGAKFLLDAAQSLGHLPLEVEALQVDLLAAPAHKGLMGPLGTGILYIRTGLETELESLFQGGTGTHSDDDRQPKSLPDKYESGNHNVPGLIGLAAAAQWLESQTVEKVCRHERLLANQLRAGLGKIPGITVHGAQAIEKTTDDENSSVGVVSVSIAGFDPQEAAAILDSNFGVQVRAGLHCAARLHRTMGTHDRGGTVRFSLGAFNTEDDVAAAIAGVAQIAGEN